MIEGYSRDIRLPLAVMKWIETFTKRRKEISKQRVSNPEAKLDNFTNCGSLKFQIEGY